MLPGSAYVGKSYMLRVRKRKVRMEECQIEKADGVRGGTHFPLSLFISCQ